MKKRFSKRVAPNMTMVESLNTQDLQTDGKMRELKRDMVRMAKSNNLWSRTATAKDLTTFAESMVQRLSEQMDKHFHKLSPCGSIVFIKRIKQNEIHCHECQNEMQDICSLCCQKSPVPRFSRIRTVSFIPLEPPNEIHSGRWTVKCDCLDGMGHPCRHIASVFAMRHLKSKHFIP